MKAIVWTLYPFEQLFLEVLLNVQGIQARAYTNTLDSSEFHNLQREFNEPYINPATRPSVEVLIVSYLTNRVGLNIHKDCSSCHLFDQPPNQVARQQVIGRTYQLGRNRRVEVIEYYLSDTFDIHQFRRITRQAMPSVMSFFDLDKVRNTTSR